MAPIEAVPDGANTLVRVLSALVLAPLAVAAAWLGGWPFVLFWLVAGAAVLWEWSSIVSSGAAPALARGIWFAAGFAYAALMVVAPLALRADAEFGASAILFLFAVVWTTDVLGYFGGRAVGGAKLAPSISPSKTWSGAISGTIGAGIVSAIAARFVMVPHWIVLTVIGVLLSVAAQIGDLGESALKRKFHRKDASHLIPGHGGVMDRLDGFWAAALCGLLIGAARSGFVEPSRGLLLW